MTSRLAVASVATLVLCLIVLAVMALTGHVEALLIALALFVVPFMLGMLDLMWRDNPPVIRP